MKLSKAVKRKYLKVVEIISVLEDHKAYAHSLSKKNREEHSTLLSKFFIAIKNMKNPLR